MYDVMGLKGLQVTAKIYGHVAEIAVYKHLYTRTPTRVLYEG